MLQLGQRRSSGCRFWSINAVSYFSVSQSCELRRCRVIDVQSVKEVLYHCNTELKSVTVSLKEVCSKFKLRHQDICLWKGFLKAMSGIFKREREKCVAQYVVCQSCSTCCQQRLLIAKTLGADVVFLHLSHDCHLHSGCTLDRQTDRQT